MDYLKHLKSLEVFRSVMKTGSFSACAQQLGVTQPSVSHHIRRLEDELGFELFSRKNGKVQPTLQAQLLLEDASKLFSATNQVFLKWDKSNQRQISSFRIWASYSFCSLLLPEILSSFEAVPDLKVEVFSASQEESVEALRKNAADVAFHTKPLLHPDIDCKRFVSARQVCVMPAQHALANKTTVSLSDLEGARLIFIASSDPLYNDHMDVLEENGLQVNQVLATPYAAVAMQMAESLNALYIGNVLAAELACRKNRGITWREVDGFDDKTSYYFALSPWLQHSRFAETVEQAVFNGLNSIASELDLKMRSRAAEKPVDPQD